jgi:hypothetical protein
MFCLGSQPRCATFELISKSCASLLVQEVLVYCWGDNTSVWAAAASIAAAHHTFLLLLLLLLPLLFYSSSNTLQTCLRVRLPSTPSMLALLLTSCTRCCWTSWPLGDAWSSQWGHTTHTRWA